MADRIVLNTISYHGHGAIENIVPELTARGYKKAFVCSDPDLIKFGVTKKVTDLLEAANFAYAVYSEIKPNPTIANVQDGVAAFKAAEADCIVTIGGGSSMDTAKAIGIIINNPEFADVRSLEGVAPTKKHAVFTIAVPTTAGTAAEVTINYVITDVEKKRKFVCVDTNDIPEIAVVDPDMMASMPKGLTAATGMDALTHALEAYVSTYATPETDRYAEMAAKMIYEALPVVREEPKNVEMREQLLVASFLAGMAFARTYVGYVHAFAHSIGGRYGVAHGLANAVLLPHIMEYYLPVSTPRLARMAQICGISSDSDESTRARAFVESIAAMNQTGGVPDRLAEFPRAEIDAVIKEAFQECHGTYPVPRYYTRPAARALLEQVCAE